jgi:Putative peptidoglycan binding domain
MMICADRELSRVDLLFNQAYWALLQQLPERERQRLKDEDVEFLNDVQEGCGIPHTGRLPADIGHARNCAREMYLEQRTTWLSRITGAAHDEATRPLEQHIVLERKLRQLGFLATPPIPEGVYGPGMRQAILGWQSARGRATTGFLSDPDAEALKREG